jgi:nucleotide-binding universal stress UspA family protein
MRILIAIEDPDHHQPANALKRLVEAASAEVHLLHVIDPARVRTEGVRGAYETITPRAAATGTPIPGATQHYPHAAEDRGQALQRARAEMYDSLKDAASRWFPAQVVEIHIDEDADTVEAILRAARQTGAALVALATHHHHGRLSPRLRTDLHEEIIQRSPVPVIVVGPEVVGL